MAVGDARAGGLRVVRRARAGTGAEHGGASRGAGGGGGDGWRPAPGAAGAARADPYVFLGGAARSRLWMPSSSSLYFARTSSNSFAAFMKAATTVGSNCLPASAAMRLAASTGVTGLRWRWVAVIAS